MTKKENTAKELKDLKNNLPVELPDRETQEFTFKNWTMKEEKQIAKLKTSSGMMGKFVSSVFQLMLNRFCGEDFDAKDTNEKILTINQLDLPNVMYMWVYLRYEVMGEFVVMDVNCPTCGRLNKQRTFNIESMDIHVKEKTEPRYDYYTLLKPFDFGGETVEKLKIRVTKWDAMESAKDEVAANEGLMKELIFRNSIIGMNDAEGHIDSASIIENLHKRDIEKLSQKISEHNGGPSLSLEDKCEFCGTDYSKFLNWSYDHFFGQSSLPAD